MVTSLPTWFADLIGASVPSDGEEFTTSGRRVVADGEILRAIELVSDAQRQTRDTFGFKWHKRDTFEGEVASNMRRWLVEKYGDVVNSHWLSEHGAEPVLLDAGCGAALSSIELFGPILKDVRYIGADVSRSVDVARDRFMERGITAAFIQADLQQLPLPPESVDLRGGAG